MLERVLLGALIGYGLRLVTRYLSDRTRQYWHITTVGYAINTAVVPLMALVGCWQVLAELMIVEIGDHPEHQSL
jgi:hypothetical protein